MSDRKPGPRAPGRVSHPGDAIAFRPPGQLLAPIGGRHD